MSDVTSDNSSGTQYITKAGASSTSGTNWTVTGASTIYAAWAKNCTTPGNGSCSLSVSDAGAVDYTTSCNTGYSISGANTATPSCSANCNAITLNANGGTAGSVATLYKKTGSGTWYTNSTCTTAYSTTTNVVPTRSGYTFRGFYLSDPADISATQTGGTSRHITHAGATTDTGNKWTITGSATLYAGWARNCAPGTKATCTLTVGLNTTYTTGCNTGYNIKSGGGTYNPVCQANTYTVTYDSNKPSTASGTISGSTANSTHEYDTAKALTANGYSLTGWTFAGWNTEADGSGTSYSNGASVENLTSTNGGTVTLYAKWTANTITLKWENGGRGTAPTSPASCTYDDTFAMPAAMTATGYTFSKWSVNNKTFSAGIIVACTSANLGVSSSSETATITGTWTANKFTVSFNGNSQTSGAPSVASIECTYDNACTAATMNTLAKTKRVFLGWSSSSTATSATYTSGGSIKNISTGAAVTLYAVWYEPTCSAGTGVNTTSLNSVSGNAPVCNRSSKDGYYCGATQTGTAGAKSLTVSCTAAGDGYYAKAGATSQTACAQGSYSTKSSASSSCTACPKGRTTSGTGTKYNATANTACSATCSNNAGVYEWAAPSWSANTVANLCTVSKCNANTYYTAITDTGYKNTCTSCGSNSGTSAGNTSTTCTCTTGYTADGSVDGASTSKSGCSLISDIACAIGQYLPASSTTCSACTAGYWCPSSAQTYSYSTSIQGRTACSAGTYQPDTGKTSCLSADKGYYVIGMAKTAQTPCTGATYQDETGKTSCKDCPDGYTANTTSAKIAASSCQISCAAGTQVATENAQCTTPSGNWYTTTSQLVNYGSTSSVNACNVATNLFNPSDYDVFWGWVNSSNEIRSYATNAFVYIPVEPNTTYIVSGMDDATTASGRYVFDIAATPVAGGTVLQRVLAGAKGKGMMITTGATAKYLGVFVLSDTDGASTSTREAKVQANVANLQIFKASDGYGIIGNTTTDHDAASDCTITCGPGQYVATAGSACVNVEAGYYATGGTVAQGSTSDRSQCTSPLTTIGYGTGANEAGDCGRKFHAGDNVIYLRSEKRGDTALNVKIGNQKFFGALSTTYSSPIKVKNGSTEYSVVNDWQ